MKGGKNNNNNGNERSVNTNEYLNGNSSRNISSNENVNKNTENNTSINSINSINNNPKINKNTNKKTNTNSNGYSNSNTKAYANSNAYTNANANANANSNDKVKTNNNIKNNYMNRIYNMKDVFKGTSTNVQLQYTEYIANASLITKMFILFIVIILFYFIFKLGSFLLIQKNGIKRSPVILDGMVKSDQQQIISTNPNVKNSKPILRSINEKNGIEYTWSCWFFIDDLYLNEGVIHKRIFSKGTNNNDTNDYRKLMNNSPGMYISKNMKDNEMNNLKFVFNTYSKQRVRLFEPFESFDIPNIPLKKWVHTIIMLKNKDIYIYINGLLKKVHHLKHIPRQNYYNIFIGDKEGFGGYISDLRYYDYSISEIDIQELFINGPNQTDLSEKNKKKQLKYTPPFLSVNWYDK